MPQESSQAKLSEAESQIQQHTAREMELEQQLAMLDSSLAAALSDNELQASAKARLEKDTAARIWCWPGSTLKSLKSLSGLIMILMIDRYW